MNSFIARFAPSPTGNLHLGGIRTALINYIIIQQYKKKYPNSKLLLRIEDTDKRRSKDEFKTNIIEGLKWLGLNFDDDAYIQSEKIFRHKDVANDLLKKNKAFKCICTTEILDIKRNTNLKNKKSIKRLCETCESDPIVQNLKSNFAIRIKIPENDGVAIDDVVQGKLSIQNKEIDNFIILRKDGTPTYMLSVVVDDYDMGVNLIIRGDDHLNNAFRQIFIYKNMNWPIPEYCHIPLIHGEDGKKLSKRHGAVDIIDLKKQGYLKESVINNLILLGWSPKTNSEIVEIDNIIKLFDIKKINKSSSIFSYKKLNFFNNKYLIDDNNYIKLINVTNKNQNLKNYITTNKEKYLRIFNIYKKNLSFYKELEEICFVYYQEDYVSKKNNLFESNYNKLIIEFYNIIIKFENWSLKNLENQINEFIKIKNIKFVEFGKPTRFLLINKENGPSVSEILFILGKKNSILRVNNYISEL